MNFTTEVLKDRYKFEVSEIIHNIEKSIFESHKMWGNRIVDTIYDERYIDDVIKILKEGGYKVTQGNDSMPYCILIEWDANFPDIFNK